jgi:dihydroorotate dehydrogenase
MSAALSSADPGTEVRPAAMAVRKRRFDLFRAGTALLRRTPANFAHRAAILALKYGLVPGDGAPDDTVLATRLWGIDFANPLGMAAGFDKDAEALDGLVGSGFGFVEAGTVTPRAQSGNPRPNLFRLIEDRALINRLGFPSKGLDQFIENFDARTRTDAIIGANIGFNSVTDDALADISTGIARLADKVSYLVVNVSCPNTPGLCAWQERDQLRPLLERAIKIRDDSGKSTPILVKISPDLDADGLEAVAETALEAKIDGLIATNTTIARPAALQGVQSIEKGGLSGPPLSELASRALAQLYRLTDGNMPIIGCGGVSNAADAYARIRAGASLVQIYTALVYNGPGFVREIKDDLAALLTADGYNSVSDAVGADHR